MAEPTDTDAHLDEQAEDQTTAAPDALVEEDLLVEDVSIDGMCGVY